MSVTVANFYELLDELFNDIDENSSEMKWRTYINRSYYATFHQLKLEMQKAGININQYKTGTHNNLYLVLDEMAKQDISVRKLALQFKDFLKKRHKADYDLEGRITWEDVAIVQRYNKNLPKLIEKYIIS